MTDESRPDPRPEPRWGQYADVPPPPPPAPSFPPPEAPAAPPARRTGDIVITTVLLLLGVLDVTTRWGQYADLGSTMRELYRIQGIGEFTAVGLAEQVGLLVNVTRAIVLVATIVVSLVLIQRRKRAFWVPLAGAAVAFVVTVGMLIFLMASDPAIAEYATRLSGG